MLLPLKMICELKKMRRDGTSIVYIQYCFTSSKRTLLNTEIEIPPNYWDDGKQMVLPDLPERFGNASELNKELKRMFRVAEDIVEFAAKRKMKEPASFAKSVFTPTFSGDDLTQVGRKLDGQDVRINKDIYFQFQNYIDSKIDSVCKDMPRIYRNVVHHLKAFEEYKGIKLTFELLDLTFYEEFVSFLSYTYVQDRRKKKIVGLKANTVGKTIRQLRTFLKNRALKKIIGPIDMEGWDIWEDEVDAVYLNLDEIEAIRTMDLHKYPHLEPYRDDLVLACLTGLRFSDFSSLVKSDVRGELLYKKQQKSRHKVVIPLRPEAQKILNARFRDGIPPATNAEFNRHIKTIAKLAGINEMITHSYRKGNKEIVETKPKWQWITSHSGRRSFCTNEFLAATPVELIMKISGHKSVKDFYKYIRISPEEAAYKMKEIWQVRGDYGSRKPVAKVA